MIHQDDLDKLVREAKRRLAIRVVQAGLILQAQAKADLSQSNPAPHLNPAAKGEFPKGRSWNLRDSVAISPSTVAEVEATLRIRVGLLPGAFYGAALKNKGWKGLPDSYATCEQQIRSALGI